ncbi:tannase/feruloyl esterase family alpha/beta hydrolase [Micromonospora zamorensis]|uniref:tannase/feruloyl esterase family alpha/beta hydrolase n=1 Tax=Micromonospora zamorensis TaxID=709883 RepID=UPI003CF12CA9
MKRRMIVLMAAAVPAAAALLVPVAANAVSTTGGAPAATTCAAVPVSPPSGAVVESVTAAANAGGTITFPLDPLFGPTAPIADVPAWCDITVTITHPGANDHVKIKLSLPTDPKKWSGRFQATGGSAYRAGDLGDPSPALVAAVKGGYVGGATDAGVGPNAADASWGLTADGQTNTPLLTNFATRSVHDLAVVGKDVANRFYHRTVSYSYFNGCSTGGRQGYAEAQEYPADFDGILANAPGIEWNRFEIATLWSQAVFNEEKVAPSKCELDAFTAAAVKACDTLDGVKDGVIDNPQSCTWDARRLVGTKVACGDQEITIDKATADAVNKIWAGPTTTHGKKLWYGQNKGSDFSSIAVPGTPFLVPALWVKYFVTKDPSFDSTKLTYASFERLFRSATRQYDDIIGTNDPNLSEFARSGGKLLSWHGQSDQLIPTQGTVDYRERVNRVHGGNKRVDNFYRLFLLPGVTHCANGSTAPVVSDVAALDALTKWVEKGQAPATLPAASADGKTTRDICRYPMVARYTGHGDTASAVNYRCVTA